MELFTTIVRYSYVNKRIETATLVG